MAEKKASKPKSEASKKNITAQPREWNWLKETDKLAKAGKLQPIYHSAEGPWFYLVRYPYLLQTPPGEDENHVKMERQLLEKHIRSYRDWINGKISSVMGGVEEEEQNQLAALVADCLRELNAVSPNRKEIIDDFVKKGPARIRRLNNDLKDAVYSLEKLHKTASIEEMRPWISPRTLRTIRECLDSLKKFKPSNRDLPKQFTPMKFKACLHLCWVKLYWFFRDCDSISGDEAEVRVGHINNYMLTQFGTDMIKVLETANGNNSRGCGAVQQAVNRYPAKKQVQNSKNPS